MLIIQHAGTKYKIKKKIIQLNKKIIQLNQTVIKNELKELVRGSAEDPPNELLEAEAEKIMQIVWYEHNGQRQSYRNGHYNCNLTTTSGDVTLKILKL